jgi:hypothetical protein
LTDVVAAAVAAAVVGHPALVALVAAGLGKLAAR